MAQKDSHSQIGQLHNRATGSKTHFCISCNFPVAVYGRTWPCLHTYCLSCASDLDKCALCRTDVARVERISCEQGLFISPATLQGFKTEQELADHARHVRTNIAAHPALTPVAGRGFA
ncbi:hypothetical protein ABBQ38_009491 [Trebouxia sp. C0009 RCD-2024]